MFHSHSPSHSPSTSLPLRSSRLCVPYPIASEESDEEAEMSRSSPESSPDSNRHCNDIRPEYPAPSDLVRSPPTFRTEVQSGTGPSPIPDIISMHPYPRAPTPTQQNTVVSRQPRPRGLVPMASLKPLPSQSLPAAALSKTQSLPRILFARLANDTPHAGTGSQVKKKGGAQKLIVPTKAFRQTFELDLTASELARKS